MVASTRNSIDWAYATLFLLLILRILYVKKNLAVFLIYYVKFTMYYFFTLLITGLHIPLFLLRPCHTGNLKWMRFHIEWVAPLLGIQFFLRGEHYVQKNKSAVMVMNHQTFTKLLGHMDRIILIAKKELLYAFPFGLSAWLCGVIFINRKNPKKCYAALDAIKRRATNGCKVWIFPEGTRNQDVNKTRTLLPFKRGAFQLAIDCQIPITPVVSSPYYFINQRKCFFGKGAVVTEVLPPIETKGLTKDDVESLMWKTQGIMQSKYTEMFREVEAGILNNYPGLAQ